jgi:hypothetical protein
MTLFTTGRRSKARACWCAREPNISEILVEPIIRAVMEADGVNPGEFAAIVRNARKTVLNAPRGCKALSRRTPS